jgi:hypothetical protein
MSLCLSLCLSLSLSVFLQAYFTSAKCRNAEREATYVLVVGVQEKEKIKEKKRNFKSRDGVIAS